MYCSGCGLELPATAQFCSQCGVPKVLQQENGGVRQERPLRRCVAEKKIAGVCAGVARYLGVDVTLVRILWVILAFYPPGLGLILYLVCWIVMPRDYYYLPAPTNPAGQESASSGI